MKELIAQKTFTGNDGRGYAPGDKVPESRKFPNPDGGERTVSNQLEELSKNGLVGTEMPEGERIRRERGATRNKAKQDVANKAPGGNAAR